MSSTIGKLVKKEARYLFRPKIIIFMAAFTIFFYPFRYMAGVWGAIGIPMVWCWLLTMSGSIRGDSAKNVSLMSAPVTRDEYVTSKYLFSIAPMLPVYCVVIAADLVFLAVMVPLNLMPEFMRYDLNSLLLVYTLYIPVISIVQSWMLYQSICGKTGYAAVNAVPFVVAVLFPVMFGASVISHILLDFWRGSVLGNPPAAVVSVLLVFAVSAGSLLISVRKCMRDFRTEDL